MTMKVFVDDIREAPEGWMLCRTFPEAMVWLETGNVAQLSLDHDMGMDTMNGSQMVNSMCQFLPPFKWPFTIIIHSANPVGADNMVAVLERAAPRFVNIKVKELPQ